MIITLKVHSAIAEVKITLVPASHNHFILDVSFGDLNKKSEISAYDLQNLFTLIRTSKIPAIIKGDCLLDTTSYHLTIEDQFAYAEYSWCWVSEEWEPLKKFISELLKVARNVTDWYIPG